MRAALLPVAVLALATTACDDVLEPRGVDSAFISVSTYANGSGGYVLSPVGQFYEDANLALNPPVAGLCELLAFDPDESETISGFATLDAGPFILAQLPAREDTLYLGIESGLRIYRLGQQAGVAHTPGDTLTVVVPVSGAFPQASIAVRTAESFEIGPVGVPEVNQDLTLTWNASPQPGSAMRYALRYANAASTGELNEQLVCIFADDGEGEIDAGFLQGWLNANQREVVATRIRASEIQVNEGSRITMISTFQVPTPLLEP